MKAGILLLLSTCITSTAFANDKVTFLDDKNRPFLRFESSDGENVGEIYLNDTGFAFKGDIDESAKILFNHLVKNYMDDWKCSESK